jgi:plastocyanin
VKDFEFSPDSIQVEPGTTVTWTGKENHDVSGDGLDSPVQKTGTYRYTFETPGEHDYECSLHPIMRGRATVSAETTPPTSETE